MSCFRLRPRCSLTTNTSFKYIKSQITRCAGVITTHRGSGLQQSMEAQHGQDYSVSSTVYYIRKRDYCDGAGNHLMFPKWTVFSSDGKMTKSRCSRSIGTHSGLFPNNMKKKCYTRSFRTISGILPQNRHFSLMSNPILKPTHSIQPQQSKYSYNEPCYKSLLLTESSHNPIFKATQFSGNIIPPQQIKSTSQTIFTPERQSSLTCSQCQISKRTKSTIPHQSQSCLFTRNAMPTLHQQCEIFKPSNSMIGHQMNMNPRRHFTTAPKPEDIIEACFREVKTFGSLDVRVAIPVHVESLDPMEYPGMDKFILEVYKDGEKGESAVNNKEEKERERGESAVNNEEEKEREKREKLLNKDKERREKGEGLLGKEAERVLNKDRERGEKMKSLVNKVYELNVETNDARDRVRVELKVEDGWLHSLPVHCVIKVPIKFNIDIQSENEKVTVKNFEGDKVSVCSNQGNIYLNKIKCGEIDIKSKGGDVISKSLLQGNINISTSNKGEIVGEKLQGETVWCCSEEGQVTIHTLYSNKTHITTSTGHLHINSCHGDTTTTTQSGHLTISSLDGGLYHTGVNSQVDVGTLRCDYLNINTDKGDVSMKVGDSVKGELNLTANCVTIDDAVMVTNQQEKQSQQLTHLTGSLNGGHETSKINIKTSQGKITLLQHSWFSSLNLSDSFLYE